MELQNAKQDIRYILSLAEERGGETDLQEAWIHGEAGFQTDKVEWQKAIDGLASLGESMRRVFDNVHGAQCEKDREESAPGHGHFAWEV